MDTLTLAPAHVAAILADAGLDGPVGPLVRLAGGYSKLVYAVADRYILRVSHYTRDGADLRREAAILDSLRDLPGVPRVLGQGVVPLDGGLPYLLLTRLPGGNVFRAWLDASPAEQLGYIRGLVRLLEQVHARPLPAYRVGYHQTALPDWTGGWLAGHDRYFQGLLAQVRAHPWDADLRGLLDEAEAYYAAHRTALDWAVGPRLVHGDLQLYNVIGQVGQVTGLIDWEWAHGGEPDFDLADLVRWALFPAHPAEEELEAVVSAATYARLVPALFALYPAVARTPRLRERLTIYQIEYDLHQLTRWPHAPRQMRQRLHGWLRDDLLAPLESLVHP